MTIFPSENKSLNGIFTHLYYNLGKEKYQKEIEYWSTTIFNNVHCSAYGLIDPTNTGNANANNYHSINDRNPFVAFHFRTKRVVVTNYTIMSRNEVDPRCTANYPQAWKLEGSNDNSTWTPLHNQPSTKELEGIGKKITLSTTNHQPFNSFKLTNTEHTETGENNFYLVLHRIEFFGIILSNFKLTCKNRQPTSSILLNIVTVVITSI